MFRRWFGRPAAPSIPLDVGDDANGKPVVLDLTQLPHLLMAGRTGSGKSCGLNAVIVSIFRSCHPDRVRLVLVDPTLIEMNKYRGVPHLMTPIITDHRLAQSMLAWANDLMDNRLALLAQAVVGDFEGSHRRAGSEAVESIVIVIDEVGDQVAFGGDGCKALLLRLAERGHRAGIHLILTTQCVRRDRVLIQSLKAAIPARIAYSVRNESESRNILDAEGAETLRGRGDLLLRRSAGAPLVRIQGRYITDQAIAQAVAALDPSPPRFDPALADRLRGQIESMEPAWGRKPDELFNVGVENCLSAGSASTSLLQRALGIGYGRAARMLDAMSAAGIVSGVNPKNTPRELLITREEWAARRVGSTP